MKSRRRIAFSKAQDCADYRSDEHNYSRDLWPAKYLIDYGELPRGKSEPECLGTFEVNLRNLPIVCVGDDIKQLLDTAAPDWRAKLGKMSVDRVDH